jgi:hypothetical protein
LSFNWHLKLVRLEIAPGTQATLIAECQIADFADAALRQSLVKLPGGLPKILQAVAQ